jgi:hypothetical protein
MDSPELQKFLATLQGNDTQEIEALLHRLDPFLRRSFGCTLPTDVSGTSWTRRTFSTHCSRTSWLATNMARPQAATKAACVPISRRP